MDVGRIAVRVLIAYAYLLFTTRASGKRVVGQATPFDFVVSIVIGDLFDDAIWAEVSLAKFGGALGSIFLCDAFIKHFAMRWDWVFRLANGRPARVLRDGREDGDALRGEQMNEADLAHLLRLDGIDDWSKVQLALVERNHEVSVVLRPEEQPAQKQDAVRVMEMRA